MQIIIMEKVVNLGNLGDEVKVKDGFARNFLIPQGKAKRATEANLKEFESRRAELEKKANELLTSAQERATRLEGVKVDVAQKAGPDGRLFGSVTNSDIAEALTKSTGIAVKKAEVRMREKGHVFFGEAFVVPRSEANLVANVLDVADKAKGFNWRIHDLVVMPVDRRTFEALDEITTEAGEAPDGRQCGRDPQSA